MKTVTLLYRYDNFARPREIVCEELAPGLLLGENPRYLDPKYKGAPKYAVFHEASALVAGVVNTKARGRQLGKALAELCAWDVDKETLFKGCGAPMLSAHPMCFANRLCRKVRDDSKTAIKELCAIVADELKALGISPLTNRSN